LHKKSLDPIFPLERLEGKGGGDGGLCDTKRQVLHGRYIIPGQQQQKSKSNAVLLAVGAVTEKKKNKKKILSSYHLPLLLLRLLQREEK